MILELVFPLSGTLIEADHHHHLYAALAGAVPEFHSPAANIRFGPIGGEPAGKGVIRVGKGSRVKVRLDSDSIPLVIPLAGKELRLGTHAVRLGPPVLCPLSAPPQLIARVVTFKNSMSPEAFIATAAERLAELGIHGEPGIPLFESGPRAGEPRRRVVRIHGKLVVGYSLLVSALLAEESLLLQERGLGGRCRIGCGFFVPYRRKEQP